MYAEMIREIHDEHKVMLGYISIIEDTQGIRIFNSAFKFHVADEESAMRTSAYPSNKRVLHEQDHARIISALEVLRFYPSAWVVQKGVTAVIEEHLLRYDKHFLEYLEKIEAKIQKEKFKSELDNLVVGI